MTKYAAYCVDGDGLLGDWVDDFDTANATGKAHEIATKGHRWDVLQDNTERARIFGEILAAVELVSIGYGLFGPKDDNPSDALGKTLDAISKVEARISEMQQKILDIEGTLNALPAEFRGIIRHEMLEEHLADVKTAAETLTDKMKDLDTFHSQRDFILGVHEDLHQAVNRVVVSCGGPNFQSLLLTLPPFTLWSNVYMMLQRTSRSGSSVTVWDTEFFKYYKDVSNILFNLNRKMSTDYKYFLDNVYFKNNIIYDYEILQDRFHQTDIPVKSEYLPNEARKGLFRSGWISTLQKKPYVTTGHFRQLPPPAPHADPSHWGWAPADGTPAGFLEIPDAGLVAKAMSLLDQYDANVSGNLQRARIMAHADEAEAKLNATVWTKPPDWQ